MKATDDEHFTVTPAMRRYLAAVARHEEFPCPSHQEQMTEAMLALAAQTRRNAPRGFTARVLWRRDDPTISPVVGGPRRMGLTERFWSKVDQSGGPDACWPWMASQRGPGYGSFWFKGRNEYAHRVAYELALGPPPDGLVIDHVRARGCTTRSCCNPRHLEAVTQRVNQHRREDRPRFDA